MGLIKFRFIFFSFLFSLLSLVPIFSAEDFGPAGTVASELQRLGAIIKDAKTDAAKKAALSSKASLLELSGNIEEAASVWNDAAFAENGKRDDNALLKSAACFAAMGEYSQADAALKTILLTGNDAQSLKEARFLSAQIEAFRGQDISVLRAFLTNPDYASYKPRINYLLWKIAGDESCKTALITDFPQSPEALLAQDENTSIVPAFTPMWLLFPGREQLTFSASRAESGVKVGGETAIPAATASSASVTVDIKTTEAENPVLIQVGLYSKQENAAAMLERLKSKGFTGTISTKTVSGTAYWQVTLPPGADANQTIMKLKDAGFESFPVF